MITSYKDLIVWQKSFQLALDIYKTTKQFPKEELFGLTSQIRRAAYSIPLNIAEGATRKHKAEFINFLSIALGSGAELETALLLATKLAFLKESDCQNLSNILSEVMKMLNTLITKLRKTN